MKRRSFLKGLGLTLPAAFVGKALNREPVDLPLDFIEYGSVDFIETSPLPSYEGVKFEWTSPSEEEK